MTFIIKANSSEAMRIAIVKWLKWNASNNRIKESQAVRVGIKKQEQIITAAYQEAAEFIESCKVETA